MVFQSKWRKKGTPRFQNQYHITTKGRKVTYLGLETQSHTQPLLADIHSWLTEQNMRFQNLNYRLKEN